MEDKSILTSASYNTYENAVKHCYFNNTNNPPRPPAPAHRPQRYSFITPLGDNKPIVRVTYYYNPHPTLPNWYLIDLAIAGINNFTQCFEVLLCHEPYYDEELERVCEWGEFQVRGLNKYSKRYIRYAVDSMNKVIPRIFNLGDS
jgi:hypothetical protein